MTAVYLITFFDGFEVWKFCVLGFTTAEIFEIIMHGKGFFFLSISLIFIFAVLFCKNSTYNSSVTVFIH